MELNVTIPQEVVQNFLKRHSEWDGDEETTPYLHLEGKDTVYQAEGRPLADDAILVSFCLQNFLEAMIEENDDPYEVWFALIKNREGIWEQGERNKVLTFDESMSLEESQNYLGLLQELRG